MTYCSTIAKPLLKKIKEGKTLDEIGAELCGDTVRNPRQKAIRLTRMLLGEETLVQNAQTLKYDTGKAQLAKKRTHKKIDAPASNNENIIRVIKAGTESKSQSETELTNELHRLLEKYGFDQVMSIIAVIQQEISNYQPEEKKVT